MNDNQRPGSDPFPLTNNAAKAQTGEVIRSEKNSLRQQATVRRSFWHYFKVATAVSWCVGFLVVGTYIGNLYYRSSLFRAFVTTAMRTPGAIINTKSGIDLLGAFKPEVQFVDKPHTINVLLLGCDSDYEDTRPVPIKNSRGRSDAIMLAKVDFDNQKISVLSIPRDTAVHIANHGIQKINAAHAFGGPELTEQTIKDVFGLDADYYLTVNFDSFQKIVDAIGGVDLTVHKKLDYDDNWANLHIHLKPGYQHLNGYHAMGYVRMRHSDSDLMRAERQHEFLEAMRDKVKTPQTLLKLPDVLNAITDNLHTNMSQEQMLTLANFARQLPHENIQLATLPSFEGPSFVYINVPESEKVIRKLFYDDGMVSVSINAPDRSLISNVASRYGTGRRHRGKHGRHVSANAPKDDNGNPLVDNDMPVVEDANPPTDNPDDSSAASDSARPAPDTPEADKTDKGDKKDKDKGDGGKGDGGKTDSGDKGDKKDGDSKGSDGGQKDSGSGTDTGSGSGSDPTPPPTR